MDNGQCRDSTCSKSRDFTACVDSSILKNEIIVKDLCICFKIQDKNVIFQKGFSFIFPES